MRTFSTTAERQKIRKKIIEDRIEARKVLTNRQSLMEFKGRAHDDKPLFSFVSPYKGFISSLIFDDSRLYKYDITIRITDLEGNIDEESVNIGKLLSNVKNTIIDQGYIVDVTLPDYKGVNNKRDILISFIFNEIA